MTGIVALAQARRINQKGDWRAILGIVLGILFLVTFSIMVVILLFPFLTGNAH